MAREAVRKEDCTLKPGDICTAMLRVFSDDEAETVIPEGSVVMFLRHSDIFDGGPGLATILYNRQIYNIWPIRRLQKVKCYA